MGVSYFLNKKIVLKRKFGDIETSTADLAKGALEDLEKYYRAIHEMNSDPRSDALVDRLMDRLAIIPDDRYPSTFFVLCPLCGWTSNTMTASGGNWTYRGQFIGTVCRTLGTHVDARHWNIFKKIRVPYGRKYVCSYCNDFETDYFLHALAHYVARHMNRCPYCGGILIYNDAAEVCSADGECFIEEVYYCANCGKPVYLLK